jgi:hypothetical protein
MGMTCEEAGMTEGGKGGQRGDNKGVCYTPLLEREEILK